MPALEPRAMTMPLDKPAAGERIDSRDIELMRAVAERRDRAAFAELFERHQRAAFNIAYHIAGDRSAAEDALQDAMLKVWTAAGRFRMEGSVHAWILRIVARQSLKLVQERRVTKERIVKRQRAFPAGETVPETPAEDRERFEALRSGLAELSEVQRRLLALYFGAEMSQREIGEALDTPQSTVSRRIQEIVDELRGRLTRAGLAAAAPVLFADQLRAMVLNAEAPPAGAMEALAPKLAQTGGSLSAKSAAAKAGVGLWLFGGVVLAVLGAGAAWHYGVREKAPAASEGPKTETIAPSPAPEPEDVPLTLPFSWDFNRTDLPPEFKVVVGATVFADDSARGGKMLVLPGPDATMLMLQLPLPVDGGVKIDAQEAAIRPENFVCTIGLTDGKTYAAMRTLALDSMPDIPYGKVAHLRWYLLDNWIIAEINGTPVSIARLRRTGGDRLLVLGGTKCAIKTLRIEAIGERELPEYAKRKMALFEQMSEPLNRDPLVPKPSPKK